MPGGVHPPLSVIASWPTPNYKNPTTRGWELVVTSIVLSVLAILVVAARLYARMVLLGKAGWEDWLIVMALVPALSIAVIACLAEQKYGFNRHVWDVPLDMAMNGRKISMVEQAVYVVCATLIKLSILMLLRRITNGVNKFYGIAVKVIMAIVIAYFIIFEVTLFTGCRPLKAYWYQVNPIWQAQNEGKYHCYNEAANIMGATFGAMITDFATFILPLILFRKLQVPFKQKFALICVFGVGLFLCIAGVMRLVVTYTTFYSTYDVTWSGHGIYFWTLIEVFLGIICASLPSLKIFFGRYLDANRSKGYSPYPGPSARSGRSGRSGASGFSAKKRKEDSQATDIELEKGIRKTTSQHIKSITSTDSATLNNMSMDATIDADKPWVGTFYDEGTSGVHAVPYRPTPALPKQRYEVWEL